MSDPSNFLHYLALAKDAIAPDERRPVLYDAKGQALVRPVGFQPKESA